ncbi:MAG: ASKHA domain-containing protein, partial [Clostridiales Family XIII bacterium]|nr:ASKHA domain-containing protein [Clostridiales Family XIII bacterium]
MGDFVWVVEFPENGTSACARDGDNLLDVMRANGVDIAADCGGHGRCGKCVCFVDGERRLACETAVDADIEVRLPVAGDGYDILTDFDMGAGDGHKGDGSFCVDISAEDNGHRGHKKNRPLCVVADSGHDGLAVAVDIGTTTLALKLVDIASGREVWASAALNSQRPYGADVISRINASMDDASVLSGLITRQIDGMIETMLRDSAADARSVRRVVVAGNTTMSYLLLGLPCRSLGLAPFTPAFSFKEEYAYDEIFHSDTLAAPVHVMPFVSAYVGGDVTSGLTALETRARSASAPEAGDGERDQALALETRARDAAASKSGDEPYILVDMGTNGEIAYHRGDRLLCTSTAAGPAFEGGNISCGSGSVEGAVSKVWIRDGAIGYETIGGAPARGICGSGLLDAMACFVTEGIVDATGAMNADSPFVDEARVVIATSADSGGEDIALTQRDVREFQLAKSAVRSGIETLIGESGDIIPDKLYLAGGFGQRLDADSAFATGLLPESVRGRVVPIGNSSLAGAVLAASDTGILTAAYGIAARGEEINLASHP